MLPLRRPYQHRAEIEAVVQGATRDATFDTFRGSIGAAIAAGRTFARASVRQFASVAWLIPSSLANWPKGLLIGGSIFVRTGAFLSGGCANSPSCPAHLRVSFQKQCRRQPF